MITSGFEGSGQLFLMEGLHVQPTFDGTVEVPHAATPEVQLPPDAKVVSPAQLVLYGIGQKKFEHQQIAFLTLTEKTGK